MTLHKAIEAEEELCIGKFGHDKDENCGCLIYRESIFPFEVEMHLEPDGSGHIFLFDGDGREFDKEFKSISDMEHLRETVKKYAEEVEENYIQCT